MKDLHSSPTHTQEPASCFKTCDIRGWAPDEFSAEIVFRIGSAIVTELKAKTVVDRDRGLERPVLAVALTRDFGYCDSGLISWPFVTARMSQTGKILAQLVDERIGSFPCSVGINCREEEAYAVLDGVRRAIALIWHSPAPSVLLSSSLRIGC